MRVLPPHIVVSGLPDGERPHAFSLILQLSELETQRRRFETGLALMDFCLGQIASAQQIRDAAASLDPNGPLEKLAAWPRAFEQYQTAIELPLAWKDLAIRDCAICVWDFRQAIGGVHSRLSACPTFKAWVASAEFEGARARLNEYFPAKETKAIRYAFTHSADLMKSPGIMKGNASVQPIKTDRLDVRAGGSNFIKHTSGRECSITVHGKLHTFRLDQQTLDRLTEVRDMTYAAFGPVGFKSREAMIERAHHRS